MNASRDIDLIDDLRAMHSELPWLELRDFLIQF